MNWNKKRHSEQGTISAVTKIKNLRWGLIKLKSFCKENDTINRTKQQPTEWEKNFGNSTSDRRLISKIN